MESVTRKWFEGVLRVFYKSLKGISRKFQMWFSKVLGVLPEYFKELPKKLKGVFSASMMFHDCFEVSSSMFCVFFKIV